MNRTEVDKLSKRICATLGKGGNWPILVADIIERASGQDGTCANPEHNDLGIHPKQPGCALWKPERPCGETAWVSVNTKTPDHNDEYLVFNGYDKLVVTADFYEGGWMTVRTFGYSGSPDDITHHVTHWAALPSPPTAEEKN